jgi:hypothetical protein
MLTWLRRLFAPQPRVVELLNRLDDLDERVEYQSAELKRLRGRVTGSERHAKRQDDPETDERPEIGHPRGTAGLKRGLRGF